MNSILFSSFLLGLGVRGSQPLGFLAMTDNGLTWTNETRRLDDLVPWERNPRKIEKAEAERLLDSLEQFGQIQTIAIGPGNEIYDGHQRKYVWAAAAKFGPDFQVDVRVASRPLTERERQQLVVYLHRGTVGKFDFDVLANTFEVDDLLEWGFSEMELGLLAINLNDVKFKEYDENIADEVEWLECPECGHRWPK